VRIRSGAVALASVAVAVPAFVAAQTALPEGVVKRPDGTVVAPAPEPERGRPEWWRRESAAEAAERERHHLESELHRQQRIDQSRRERAAAQSNPARQVAPAQGR
jgi:hypothetical protein